MAAERGRDRERERERERGGREKGRGGRERGERFMFVCKVNKVQNLHYDLHTLSRSMCVFAPHHGSYDLEYCIVR